MKELREFEIRFDGLYGEQEVFVINDGHLKHDREIVQVIESTPLTQNAADMLKALKSIVMPFDCLNCEMSGAYEGKICREHLDEVINIAKAAISKAEG